ncbi:hypothetical protein BU23DRAFT_264647 [Bimuria novae-zelandiae CBS 107.79]|uniref:RING-type domain-containing protein n=1 Tax=Bimuria novae-zelandiae CBS 107.79 TaxID=1447943 RepID=A0A6A5UT38_9PLEO|nr:hypothetical protein BU23DRAFT_264647 [Bimuria novae-zelandiae CBS 107.79]
MPSPAPIPTRRSSRASSNAVVDAAAADVLPNRRTTIAKQPPDLHLLEYLKTPDSNLVCLICHSPFDKPVQLFCGHFFCRDCLDHAWLNQPEGRKTCPTCRSRIDPDKDTRPVPKIIETMLDELVVKCPHSKSGCGWVEQRVNVHDHVMLYCDYTLVECAQRDCRLHISQKDFHKGCLHYTVSCEDCHVSMMKKDLEVCCYLSALYLMAYIVNVGPPANRLCQPVDQLPSL